ncbi:MAG: glycosyl hydrolase [Candidatus Dojkabacteria bacterium]|nr:glycosyl hydrolase [Candidatus Dojkabacteria bacterium]
MNHRSNTASYLISILILLIVGLTVWIILKKNSTADSDSQFSADSDRIPLVEGKASFDSFEHLTDLFVDERLKEKPIPTNKIWSSVAFNGHIEGAYFFPYAVKSDSQGLHIGIPSITASTKTVVGSLGGEYLSIRPQDKDIDRVEILDFSDLTIRTAFYSEKTSDPVFEVVFIQGSPYVFIKSYLKKLEIIGNSYELSSNEEIISAHRNNHNIGFFTSMNTVNNSENTITLSSTSRSDYLTLGMYTDEESFQKINQYSKNIIENVHAEIEVLKDAIRLDFIFTYQDSQNEKGTIWGVLPHHKKLLNPDNTELLYTIQTVRGIESFLAVRDTFSLEFRRRDIPSSLSYRKLSKQQINQLNTVLIEDINSTAFTADSSYFAGKQLARAARLIQIADEIENPNGADRLSAQLKKELINWFTYVDGEESKYFKYDKKLGGLIAVKTEFGSENYNDHHFHYGYFLYAASVISERDEQFREDYGDFIEILARDYASWKRDDPSFPFVRVYDWYENHSWATGIQGTPDGNNQESTSEAINAWYSLWLWSRITENENLQALSEFLYTSEILSAETYWLNRNESPESIGLFPEGYDRLKASLVWGGKYEYSTFFSADQLAVDGIQYLPFTPGSIYLKNDVYIERDRKFINEYLNLPSDNTPWMDINLMYYAMLEGEDIMPLDVLMSIPIDDGNSRSNLLAWIYYWSP